VGAAEGDLHAEMQQAQRLGGLALALDHDLAVAGGASASARSRR
jgi:hypothetical protein